MYEKKRKETKDSRNKREGGEIKKRCKINCATVEVLLTLQNRTHTSNRAALCRLELTCGMDKIFKFIQNKPPIEGLSQQPQTTATKSHHPSKIS